jgi:hypothetical protein
MLKVVIVELFLPSKSYFIMIKPNHKSFKCYSETMVWVCDMPKMKFRQMGEDYVYLLKLVKDESIPEVAKDLSITEGAVRGRLQRGRQLIRDANWFTMAVKNLQKNERVRKFSISAELEAEEE